ncbi:MAG: family 20 glycosylhydrolase [Candidatus Dadabacteria bacterium]
MNKLFLLFLFVSGIAYAQTSPSISIIPRPVQVKAGKGSFTITKKTVIAAVDEEDRKAARFLNDYLQELYGLKLDIDRKEKTNFIRLSTRKFVKAPDKETYSLTVNKDGVLIEGDSYSATFNGVQSLIQLLPVTSASSSKYKTKSLPIPQVSIYDYPRFSYRGMHLDVARHFFPMSFVKRYIDYLALHKMNYFHWHLTDDQGWRIEIKKYPNLITTGAWRNGTIIGRYPGTGNDNTRYGGYYTQEDVKDVLRYAADRHITVIPEIEMPGHASAAIASYPWLSCFPGKETVIPSNPSIVSQQQHGKKVQETFGVFEDVFCAGKDSTFVFLQNVMDEVLSLFPSSYIHVGGDECPKDNWKICPNCQKRIKDLGLKDEHELQSYFIQRMEKYLNSKGRTLIGWDEILEGGLAPNAVVMSWRGEQGGIQAANENHKVVMTPGEYVYFDHSQTRNEDSVTIGGYTPLERVYSYQPIPKELDSTKAKYILGAQANLWTEYIAYPSKVEYMIFPRMSALSEVLWSEKDQRSWSDFERRLQTQFRRYELWKANYSKAYFDLKATIWPFLRKTDTARRLLWSITPKMPGVIKVTRDGSQIFQSKGGTATVTVNIHHTGSYTATEYSGIKVITSITQNFYLNKATGKTISITNQPNEKYPGQNGAFSLVNGVFSSKGLSFPDWLGWIGDDMDATIDLGNRTPISSVRIHTLDQNGSWVYLPQDVEVFTSEDGKNFTPVGKNSEFVKDNLTMGWITVAFPQQQTHYVRVVAKNYGMIPTGKPGAGNKAWMMVDEIQVN